MICDFPLARFSIGGFGFTGPPFQILVTDKKIDQVNDLIPLLEAMVQAKEPLLIVAEDVVGEALSALVVNKMRGVLDVVRGCCWVFLTAVVHRYRRGAGGVFP